MIATLLVAVSVPNLHAGEREEYEERAKQVEAAYETIFFSVLDGCFQDGLSNADVDQILLRTAPNKPYEHFIYACPICMATARALEAYRAGPNFVERKVGGKVKFGGGLTPEMHAKLYSADPKERLAIIHDLEENWVSRRVSALRLTPAELALVQKQLKLAREDGMRVMQNFEERGKLDEVAPAYHSGDECALCNAAVGMKLKLAPDPSQ